MIRIPNGQKPALHNLMLVTLETHDGALFTMLISILWFMLSPFLARGMLNSVPAMDPYVRASLSKVSLQGGNAFLLELDHLVGLRMPLSLRSMNRPVREPFPAGGE